jgi:hypothetical protein
MMRSEVLNHVKIDMPEQDTKKVMENHGFKVKSVETWKGVTLDFGTPIYLECSRIKPQTNPAHNGIVLDEIFVYLPIEAGKVKDVKVRHIKTSM